MRSAFFLCFTYKTNLLNTFIIPANTVRFLLATHCSNAKRQPLLRFFYSLKHLSIKNEIKLPFHESFICMAIQYADLYCNYIMQIIIKLKELFMPGHGRSGLNS